MSELSFIREVESYFTMTEKDLDHKSGDIYSYDYPYIMHLNGQKIGCMYLNWDKDIVSNHVHVCYLYIYKAKEGTGTVVLNKVCELADKYGITLFLDAAPQKPTSESIEQLKLKSWYKLFGFIHSEVSGSNDMERAPNT